MDSLEKAETVEDTITKLPDTVKPDDIDAGKLVNEAKEQYKSLTEHEKSLISDELRENLKACLTHLLIIRSLRVMAASGKRYKDRAIFYG